MVGTCGLDAHGQSHVGRLCLVLVKGAPELISRLVKRVLVMDVLFSGARAWPLGPKDVHEDSGEPALLGQPQGYTGGLGALFHNVPFTREDERRVI